MAVVDRKPLVINVFPIYTFGTRWQHNNLSLPDVQTCRKKNKSGVKLPGGEYDIIIFKVCKAHTDVAAEMALTGCL